MLVLLSLLLLLSAALVPRTRAVCAGFVIAVITVTGALLKLADHQLHPSQIGEDLRLAVQIQSIPERSNQRLTFLARVISCDSCERNLSPTELRLSWYGSAPNLQSGDIWQLTVRLKPPQSLRNPGGFDALKWAISKQIHAKGYVRQPENAIRLAQTEYSLNSFRQNLATTLSQMPSANEQLGLVTALSLGIRQGVDADVRNLLRDTGTAHLLAISGLHISLMALWGFLAGKGLSKLLTRLTSACFASSHWLDERAVGLCLSFTLAAMYALLAGFGLPTQRAMVMIGVGVAALWVSRYLPPTVVLGAAVVAVMLINPLFALSVGFWLSFGAVGLLLYLHQGHLNDRLRKEVNEVSPANSQRDCAGLDRLLRAIAPWIAQTTAVARTQLMLGLLLLPAGAWFFQTGSLVAPLANLLAVPWTGLVIVPLSLISTALGPIAPTIAAHLLSLAQYAISWLINWLSLLETTLPSAITLSLPGVLVYLLCLCGLLGLFSPRGLGLRWIAIPLIVPALVFNVQRPLPQGFELHVLDVGQGLAALVFTRNSTLLFDTGGKISASLSMFEAVVEPYLHAKGRRTIDTMVISHGDEDHSFGAAAVVERFPDVTVISSQPLDLPAQVQQTRCVAGAEWTEGHTRFAFLHPAEHDVGSTNNLSCVLLVYEGSGRVLLTGDIESEAESVLAGRMSLENEFSLSVLVAPHHGSSSSSTKPWLAIFKPEHVVFSSGQRNRYGFPHAEVQLRYEELGSRSYTTGYDGAVSFRVGDSGLLGPPDTWWISHRRFWHGILNSDCWHASVSRSNAWRLLELAQKGQKLCGK